MNNGAMNKVQFFNTLIHLSVFAAAAMMFGGCTPSPQPISNTTSVSPPPISPNTATNSTATDPTATDSTATKSIGDAGPTEVAENGGVLATANFGIIPKEKLPQTAAQWKKKLSPQQYYVMREEGTERAFTGELWDSKKSGYYICVGCNSPLFHSKTKFESGSGWPSFWQPTSKEFVEERADFTFGGYRTEVHCKNCGSHLGHVFDDGPAPTGLRYCINSASLKIREAKVKDKDKDKDNGKVKLAP